MNLKVTEHQIKSDEGRNALKMRFCKEYLGPALLRAEGVYGVLQDLMSANVIEKLAKKLYNKEGLFAEKVTDNERSSVTQAVLLYMREQCIKAIDDPAFKASAPGPDVTKDDSLLTEIRKHLPAPVQARG